VIQGSYQILQPTAGEPFEAVQSGSVSEAKPLMLPLPTEQGLEINECEATVISDGAAPVVLRVPIIQAKGTLDVRRDQKGGIELAASENNVVLSMIK
jgi:hypothetical protein